MIGSVLTEAYGNYEVAASTVFIKDKAEVAKLDKRDFGNLNVTLGTLF